jgi:hypothetical protein
MHHETPPQSRAKKTRDNLLLNVFHYWGRSLRILKLKRKNIGNSHDVQMTKMVYNAHVIEKFAIHTNKPGFIFIFINQQKSAPIAEALFVFL